MRKALLATVALLSLCGAAHAAKSTDAPVLPNCYLEDNGAVYIDGPCQFLLADHKGAFFINDGKFEGMASRDNTGAMYGAWYSLDDKSPLRGTLEELHRTGPCWSNSTQRICAGKPGEQVSPHHASAMRSTASHSLPACSAKFVDDWNNWVPVNPGDKRPFAMPTTPCRMNDPAIGSKICDSKDCVGLDETAGEAIEERP
jgi:hypothetical protein